jgi:hypothetical protein
VPLFNQPIGDEAHVRFARHFGALGLIRQNANPESPTPKDLSLGEQRFGRECAPSRTVRASLEAAQVA